MAPRPPHGFVAQPTIIAEPKQIVVDPYGVQFGDARIKYDDVVSVLYNASRDNDAAAAVAATVVLNVRSSANSPVSGLPQYKLLEFGIQKEAMGPVTAFIGKIKELKVPISETSYTPAVFNKVFAA